METEPIIYKGYVKGEPKEPSKGKQIAGVVILLFLLTCIAFGIFSCKPEVVKPEKRTFIELSVTGDTTIKNIHIEYTDSNLNTQTIITKTGLGYGHMFKSGKIKITAYLEDSSEVFISITKYYDNTFQQLAQKIGKGKQEVSYDLP